MAKEQLKAFLQKIQHDNELRQSIKKAATATEIANIASSFGYEFTGDELKGMSNESIPGIKVKKQDISPSYSFGESGN